MVPRMGLEPIRITRQILSLLRLPISPPGHVLLLYKQIDRKANKENSVETTQRER